MILVKDCKMKILNKNPKKNKFIFKCLRNPKIICLNLRPPKFL